MNLSPIELGKRIRKARGRAQLTQAKLADAAGVAIGTLSRLERGAFEPSLSTAARLAEVMGMDLDHLVHGVPVGREPDCGHTPRLRKLCDVARELMPQEQDLLLDLARSLKHRRSMPSRGRSTR